MRTYYNEVVTIRHWLPILTFCPVNNLPDLLYVSVTFDDGLLHELYDVRKRMKKILSMQNMFMEVCAQKIAEEFPDASEVTVRLAFSRHVVTRRRINVPVN